MSDRYRGFLNMLSRNSSIVPTSDMTGILEFGGIWKKREQVYGAPGYWVLRAYAEPAGGHRK
jgi:alpha-N-arabinofuranosidase